MKDKSYITIEQIGDSFRKVNASFEDNNSILNVKSIKESVDYKGFKKPRLKTDRLVIGLDSKHASTIKNIINIERDNPKKEINKEEVDKLVFKALWEFLNKYRSWSFNKMDIADFEMVLADIGISGVFLDGKKVFDPTGFKGKELTVHLRGTFMPRDMIPMVEYFNDFAKSICVVERFIVPTLMIDQKVQHALHCGRKATDSFVFSDDEIKYNDTYDLSISHFIKAVSDPLKVEDWEAEEILDRFFNGKLSKKVSSFVNKQTKPHFEKLVDIADDLIDRRKKGKLFVSIPKEFYKKAFDKSSYVEFINPEKMLESQGLNVIINEDNTPIYYDKSFLSLITYPLFPDHYKRINNLLKKRSKWLVPNNK